MASRFFVVYAIYKPQLKFNSPCKDADYQLLETYDAQYEY